MAFCANIFFPQSDKLFDTRDKIFYSLFYYLTLNNFGSMNCIPQVPIRMYELSLSHPKRVIKKSQFYNTRSKYLKTTDLKERR